MTIPAHAKIVAQNVIQQIAQDEVDMFDMLWDEYERQPDAPLAAAASAEHRHGFGAAEVGMFVLSTIVIPVVVEVLKHAAKRSYDDVAAQLKKRSQGKLSDVDAGRAAAAIIAEAEKQGERDVKT